MEKSLLLTIDELIEYLQNNEVRGDKIVINNEDYNELFLSMNIPIPSYFENVEISDKVNAGSVKIYLKDDELEESSESDTYISKKRCTKKKYVYKKKHKTSRKNRSQRKKK